MARSVVILIVLMGLGIITTAEKTDCLPQKLSELPLRDVSGDGGLRYGIDFTIFSRS